ncbi:MAG: hypothetical protein QNJ13_12020 [Paracoccaceae bacterium]|nr:hypothetical protein [Paracoccaceae bacterium]
MEVLLGLLLLGLAGGAAVGLGGGDDDDGIETTTLENEEVNKEELNFIEGTEDGETLDGEDEGDWILGNGGWDYLNGHGGDDYLESGTDESGYNYSYDYLYGGAGNDTLDASQTTSWNYLNGGEGADTILGGEGGEYLIANGYEDSSWNSTHSDFYGDDGETDILNGNGGSDQLLFAGGDVASGGEGRDTFFIYDTDDAAEDNNPATITDFDTEAGERLYVYGDVSDEEGHDYVDATELSWTTDGDDVLVQVGGETIAVLEDAAEGFTDSHLHPVPVDPVAT